MIGFHALPLLKRSFDNAVGRAGYVLNITDRGLALQQDKYLKLILVCQDGCCPTAAGLRVFTTLALSVGPVEDVIEYPLRSLHHRTAV